MPYLEWKKLLFTPLCVIYLFSLALGQSSGDIKKTLEFDGEDVEKTISFDIAKGSHLLSAILNGEIESGSLYVSVIDPEGNRKNGFSLVCGDADDAQYEITTSSGGSVFNVHKSGKGSNEVRTESSGSGTSSVIVSSSESGSGNTITIRSNKDKDKKKSKNKNSNSNSNSDDDSTYTYVSSSDKAGAKGVFVESIDDPIPGTWKFIIEGEDVKGKLEIEVKQD
jgi:hypothetical protein